MKLKKYEQPALTVMNIQQDQMLCILSLESNGLGEGKQLNFDGGAGNMEDGAYAKDAGDWDIWEND